MSDARAAILIILIVLTAGCSTARVVPPDPCPRWVRAYTSTTMSPNTCYFTDSAQELDLRLPDAVNFGDVVAVKGVGGGPWRVTLQPNQTVIPTGILSSVGAIWTLRGTSNRATTVASSADGTTLLAAEYYGQIHISTDGGASWRIVGPNKPWVGIVSSWDGSLLLAAASDDAVYSSTDDGATWNVVNTTTVWRSMTGDSQAKTLVAAPYAPAALLLSNDSGASWNGTAAYRVWETGAVSGDGNGIAAIELSSNQIYVSTDAGHTWQMHTPDPPLGTLLSSVAFGARGDCLVAGEDPGKIYRSTDGGDSWQVISGQGTWYTLSVSGNFTGPDPGCTRILAGGMDGLYTSPDGGATWLKRAGGNWMSTAVSADGALLIAASATAAGSEFYTSEPRTAGPDGAILGGTGQQVILQYAGGGLWTVIGSIGNLGLQ